MAAAVAPTASVAPVTSAATSTTAVAAAAQAAASAFASPKALPPELYLGCYADFKEDRAAPYYLGQGPQMNSGKCNELAKFHGFRVFGLEQGQYGTQCWGTNELRLALKHSPGGAPADKCPATCSGETTKCGGFGHLSLYKTTPIAQYIGCFGDSPADPAARTLVKTSKTMTISKCLANAKAKGFVAGDFISLREGNKCYAEKAWPQVAKYGEKAGTCKLPCTGDDRQMCGGKDNGTVFRILALDEKAQTVADAEGQAEVQESFVPYLSDVGDTSTHLEEINSEVDVEADSLADQEYSALVSAERESWTSV
eukprot:tig00021319_g20233.t1